MVLWPKLGELAQHLLSVLLPFGSTFSLASLGFSFFAAMIFLVARHWRRRRRLALMAVLRAIFSKDIVLARSTRADLGYFLINVFALGGLIGWAAFSAQSIGGFVFSGLDAQFGPRAPLEAPEIATRAGMTLWLFLAYELGYWIDHYLKHRIPALWEFHRTHHTAERLTPCTVWRVHPIDTLLFGNVVSTVVGAAWGMMSYVLGAQTREYALDGANLLLVVFVYAYVHLQHSEFWIPFTGLPGRVFMSPAHHQIHHSIDPAHFNANLGSCLAIWDWAFGTLKVPESVSPRLKFGVEMGGVDPNTVTELLISPFRNAISTLIPRTAADPAPLRTHSRA